MDLSDSFLNPSIFLVATSSPPTQRSIYAPIWGLPHLGIFFFLLALHYRANLRTPLKIAVQSTHFSPHGYEIGPGWMYHHGEGVSGGRNACVLPLEDQG